MKAPKGVNNYNNPKLYGDVYVGKERVEFGGDLVDTLRDIVQKFGIDAELITSPEPMKRRH